MTIQGFDVKVNHHDHAGLDCDSEQRDVSNPHGDAEVEPHHVLEQQSAGHRIHSGKDRHDRFGHRLEACKAVRRSGRRQLANDRQALSRAQLELILSRPFQRVSGGQMELSIEHALRVVDVTAVVRGRQVNVDVAGELTVFVADHRRSRAQSDTRDFAERNLRARATLNQRVWSSSLQRPTNEPQ